MAEPSAVIGLEAFVARLIATAEDVYDRKEMIMSVVVNSTD
jgi:hypothetical protein